MSIRKPRWGRIAIIALAAVALSVLFGTAASQSASARTCESGAVKSSYYWRQPGSASVWFTSADSPAGCYQIRPKIASEKGLVYTGGWIDRVGIQSTAQVDPDPNVDGTGLQWAEIEKHTPGSSLCTKKPVYPLPGPWSTKRTAC